MLFQKKLQLALGALLAFSFGIAAISYQDSVQSTRLLERSRLAHEILQEYLDILNSTYEFYTVLGRNVIALDGVPPVSLSTEVELIQRLERQSRTLRQLMAEELIVLDRQGLRPEQEEADRLTYVDQRISSLVRRYRNLLNEQGSVVTPEFLRERISLLDATIGTEFRAQVKNGIAYEQSQVVQTDQTVRDLIEIGQAQIVATSIAALLFSLLSAFWLISVVRRSFQRLQAGADAFAAGELSHRVSVESNDEFGGIARRFNAMAEELEARRSAVQTSQAVLERAVDERSRRLNEMNLGLVEAEHGRRRFLADLSHELRTPLTIIRGECDVALRNTGGSEEAFRKCLGVILEQAKQTSGLVDDLLFIARKEAGELRMKLQEVDVVELVHRIVDEVRTLCQSKHLKLDCNIGIGDDPAIYVAGDPRRLKQLLLVLFDNAVKYSPAETTIRVEVKASNSEAEIVIEDEGVGVPEFELPHVFERYYRGGNAGAHHGEGVGLGLPVAKAIVEAHLGTIDLESMADRGTRVVVTLPVAGYEHGVHDRISLPAINVDPA